MSMWRKRNASSPSNAGSPGRISSFRTRASRRPPTCGRSSSGDSSETAPRWKSLPSIEARSRMLRSPGASRSRRAASSAWIVGGTTTSALRSSRTIASICSTKSGLPSAASAIRVRVSAERRSAATSSSTRRYDSSAESGSSSTVVAFSFPPPHAGRASSSSGRDRQRRRMGASRLQSVRWSRRSRNVGSAQFRSSTTTTSGRSRVSRSKSFRTAQAVSSGAAGSPPSPTIARSLLAELGAQLVGEPRLADPGRAEEREEDGGPLLDGSLERLPQLRELAAAADERRVKAPRERLGVLADGQEPVRLHRLPFALQLEWVDGGGIDRVADEEEGRAADQDL